MRAGRTSPLELPTKSMSAHGKHAGAAMARRGVIGRYRNTSQL